MQREKVIISSSGSSPVALISLIPVNETGVEFQRRNDIAVEIYAREYMNRID